MKEELRTPEANPNGGAKEATRANVRLTQELDERKRAQGSLQGAYTEIKRMRDRLLAENVYLQQEVAQRYNFGEMVGKSVAMSRVLLRIEQVAALNAPVLLRGEPGTGKGIAARAIHTLSGRRERPMIAVNLLALPTNLFEGELFGWQRGECTGADTRLIGRFELAHGGTIFLDEIAALSLELQGRLLRLINDGEIERQGSPRAVKVDVRVIAASSRDLEAEVRDGRFREDLYYRLGLFPITIPPLRERREDIPLLVRHFIAKCGREKGVRLTAASRDTLSALAAYSWPGNVRELENVVERAVITSRGGQFLMPCFPGLEICPGGGLETEPGQSE